MSLSGLAADKTVPDGGKLWTKAASAAILVSEWSESVCSVVLGLQSPPVRGYQYYNGSARWIALRIL